MPEGTVHLAAPAVCFECNRWDPLSPVPSSDGPLSFPFLSFTLVVARYDYEDEIYFKGAFLPNIHQLAEIIQSIVQNEETEPYSPDFMKVDENGESTRMISDEEYKRKAVGFLKKMALHNKACDARDMMFENVGQLKVENVKLLLSVAPKSGGVFKNDMMIETVTSLFKKALGGNRTISVPDDNETEEVTRYKSFLTAMQMMNKQREIDSFRNLTADEMVPTNTMPSRPNLFSFNESSELFTPKYQLVSINITGQHLYDKIRYPNVEMAVATILPAEAIEVFYTPGSYLLIVRHERSWAGHINETKNAGRKLMDISRQALNSTEDFDSYPASRETVDAIGQETAVSWGLFAVASALAPQTLLDTVYLEDGVHRIVLDVPVWHRSQYGSQVQKRRYLKVAFYCLEEGD